MALKKIIKDIVINAPKEKVRHVLLDDETYRIRCAEFMPGSHVVTDRQKGSEARFLSAEGSGLLGVISENKPNEYLAITYQGMVNNNIDDTESDAAKAFKGATETYTLSDDNGAIHLHVEAEMDEQRYDDMNTARDRAMSKIKELSEIN